MQSENRFFDDFAKLMNGAAGTAAGVAREAEAGLRERLREWMGGMDMVTREEFDAVKAIAIAAREESLALKARLDALDGAAAKPAAGRSRKAEPPENPPPG